MADVRRLAASGFLAGLLVLGSADGADARSHRKEANRHEHRSECGDDRRRDDDCERPWKKARKNADKRKQERRSHTRHAHRHAPGDHIAGPHREEDHKPFKDLKERRPDKSRRDRYVPAYKKHIDREVRHEPHYKRRDHRRDRYEPHYKRYGHRGDRPHYDHDYDDDYDVIVFPPGGHPGHTPGHGPGPGPGPGPGLRNRASFVVHLTPDQEVPPLAPGPSGMVNLRLDPRRRELCLYISYRGLPSPVLAELHRGRPANTGPLVIDLGLLQSGQRSCVPANRNDLEDIADDPGGHYLHLHTAAVPTGVIRGQLIPAFGP